MSEITNFKGETSPSIPNDTISVEVQSLMQRVGKRVKKVRKLKGITRRILSQKSRVSQRYLAQLENGKGNISIGLLQRVAVALDHKIEWFVGEEDPWNSDALRIAELYRSSTAEKQQRAMAALGTHSHNQLRSQRICLIGLRGAGKSTLGSMVAQRLHVPFLELNIEIEEHAGIPVTEIMALYGQEGYRQLESQALSRIIATHDKVILAAAGGVVTEPDTFITLLAHYHTIWIKTSPDEHMKRVVSQGDTRPMAGNTEAMDQLRSILKSREKLYSRADDQLDTAGKSLVSSVEELVNLISDRSYLDKEPVSRKENTILSSNQSTKALSG